MSIKVDLAKIKNVSMEIEDMGKRANNLTPVWKSIGSYLSMANRKQFATNGAYYGTPWKPLKPEYLQWKIKSGYSKRTLVQTGAMKASFTSRPMSIEKYYPKRAEFGSSNRLAKFHQSGTRRNGKPAIPARPIMVKNRRVTKAVRQMISDYIINGRTTGIRGYI